jgi:protein CpxP
MSKKKLTFISIITLVVINMGVLSFLVLVKPPLKRPMPREVIIEKLNLDELQTTAYDKLIKQHRNAISEKQKGIQQAKNELYSILTTDNVADKHVLMKKLALLQKDVEEINFQHFVALKNICKPEQMNNFTELSQDLAKLFSPKPPNKID